MERNDKIAEERLLSNSNETEAEETENWEQENEEEEEALSLCDLPIKKETRQSKRDTQQETQTIQDEFDFCSFSTESEMCSADQVFFQGQILPFRCSVSSETGLISSTSRSSSTTSRSNSTTSRSNSNTSRRCLSRSESMDTYYSSGFTSTSSSRSSSQKSSTPIYKPRTYNNFTSQPSPKPQMKFSRIKNHSMPNCNKKSTVWSLFRLGIVTTPEIDLSNLKHRSINNNKSFQKTKSFGNHSINDYDNYTRSKSEKKKKQGIFEVNGTLFGSCKCSSNAVDTIPSRIGKIEKSANAKDAFTHEEIKGTKQQQEGKQSISRNRTFEWLKQISLDGSTSLTNDA